VNLEILKNANLEPEQIETLRLAVGWDSLEGKYQSALAQSFAHYSIIEQQELIAFARVISDGVLYALIVDVMVHPAFQARGLGGRMLEFVLEDLKLAGIKSVNVIFDARLEKFYESFGFEMSLAGTIKMDSKTIMRYEKSSRV
jgi:N-acetylglutamate synthase-like GNAT family acetyltransferase